MGCGVSSALPLGHEEAFYATEKEEKEVPDALHTETTPPKDEPLKARAKVTECGISLRALKHLRDKILPDLAVKLGVSLESLTTSDVVSKWVRPTTTSSKCRLVEIPDVINPADVGKPLYFVSHAWLNSIMLLIRGVLDFLAHADDNTRVWLDIAAVNQHGGTVANHDDVAGFEDVIRCCKGGTIVILDADAQPASRAWCLYEWDHTLFLHGPELLYMPFDVTLASRIIPKIDVNHAEAFSADDRAMILERVVAHHGSTQEFNDRLKLQLMLKPLGYHNDILRLTKRADASTMNLDLVRSWISDPKMSRVLVIQGPLGTGKSSVLATLCSSSQNSGVSAYHFVKHNDARTHSGVAVVKSLAFQLAKRYPSLRPSYWALSPAEVASITYPEAACRTLLRTPLQEAMSQGEMENVVVLLDGLDEADPQEGVIKPCANQILQLVVAYFCRLPANVRFLLSLTPGTAGGRALEVLQMAYSDVTVVNISRILQRRTAVSSAPSPPSNLPEEAPGNPDPHLPSAASPEAAVQEGPTSPVGMQACVLTNLVVRQEVLGETGCGEGTEEELEASFSRVFDRAWSTEKGRMQNLLAALAAAPEPLSASILQAMDLSDILQDLPGWGVLFFESDHRIHNFHKSLSDWLRNPQRSGKFSVSVARGNQLLASYLLTTVENPTTYTFKYTIHHLAANHGCQSELGQVLPFLLKCFQAGYGHLILHDLASMPQAPPMALDLVHWLRGAESAVAMNPNALTLCEALTTPVGTALFRAAETISGQWTTLCAFGNEDWPAGIMHLQGHDKPAQCVGFGYNGRWILTGGKDAKITIWDSHSGQRLASFYGYAPVQSAAVTSDHATVICVFADGSVRKFDVITGLMVVELSTLPRIPGTRCASAISIDGSKIAIASVSGTRGVVRVWDMTSLERIAEFSGHMGMISSVAISGDARFVASGGEDGFAMIWDLETFSSTSFRHGYKVMISALTLGATGKKLATGTANRFVRVWEVESQNCLLEASLYSDILSVALSSEDTYVFVGCQDGSVKIWDVHTQAHIRTVQEFRCPVNALATNAEKDMLLAALDDGCVRAWLMTPLLQPESNMTCHNDWVMALATYTSKTDQGESCLIASGASDGSVRIWELYTGQCKGCFQKPRTGYQVNAMCFTADGRKLITGTNCGAINLYVVDQPEVQKVTLDAHGSFSVHVAAAPTGSLFASCGGRNTPIKLWDAETHECVREFTLDDSLATYCIAFGSKCRGDMESEVCMITGHSDGGLMLWDTSTSQPVCHFEGHAADIASVSLAAKDLHSLASVSYDGTLRIWDTQSATCSHILSSPHSVGSSTVSKRLYSVALHPEMIYVAVGGDSKEIIIWDLRSRSIVQTLHGHSGPVMALTFDAAGKHLISGSKDASVRVWEVA